jgi:exodeoxyribonuclease VII large subunit
VGNLQAAFEQLKTKLRDKGLFDAKHKKPLPTKVDTIGVISSYLNDADMRVFFLHASKMPTLS